MVLLTTRTIRIPTTQEIINRRHFRCVGAVGIRFACAAYLLGRWRSLGQHILEEFDVELLASQLSVEQLEPLPVAAHVGGQVVVPLRIGEITVGEPDGPGLAERVDMITHPMPICNYLVAVVASCLRPGSIVSRSVTSADGLGAFSAAVGD